MTANLRDNARPLAVIVMGVTGAGKTTVGTLLAEKMNCSFFDADDFHPAANVAKMKSGQPLSDADRLPWLRKLRALIEAELNAGRSLVLACSALRQKYRDALVTKAGEVIFVYLKIAPDTAHARLETRAGHYMPPALVPSQFGTLEEPRDAIVIDGELPPMEAASLAAERLRIA